MPLYEYLCPKCENRFEEICTYYSGQNKKAKCPDCGAKADKQIPTGIMGGSTAEPWEYDYTHKMKPKFVKDSEGNRHKFDPTKHTKGRRGQG